MKIFIDGIIYQEQARGGISRLYNEILPRMCNIETSLYIKFLVPEKPKQSFPEHPHIKYCNIPKTELYLRPSRLWNPVMPKAKQFVRDIWIGRGKNYIWNSTNFTMPPDSWKGFKIVTIYDMIYERFTELFPTTWDAQFRKRKADSIKKADAFICISKSAGDDLQKFYNINSDIIHVVHLSCSDIFRQLNKEDYNIKIPTDKPFLLYVGDRRNHKNFSILIDAYSKWKQRNEVALVIVGSQWTIDESYRIAKSGIRDNIYLLMNIDDEKLCQIYNQAVAFVYPSLYEGFGIPLLEAMACGCPIIASHIPSTIEVAGDCPIYFEPTEKDDLIRVFDAALSEGRNSDRVKNGLKKVTSYSWNKTAEQMLEVFHKTYGY